VSLSTSGTGHNVVDVDTKDRVDNEIKEEHLNAIHEDEVVVFEGLCRLKVQSDAHRLITCKRLCKVENNGCWNQTCIYFLYHRHVPWSK